MAPYADVIVGIVAGLLFSLLLGMGVVEVLNRWLKKRLGVLRETHTDKYIPSWFTGLLERTVFFFIVVAQPTSAPTAMMAWLGIKMVAGWNKPLPEDTAVQDKTLWHRHAFAALLSGLASMAFAWGGGMLARWVMGKGFVS
jgi:hypothetical protein